ncbi:MAG: sigma-E factor negative regulatory protein [Neisseriaceae bacterium]|nr:sigma-E factor negative regulatory protein [Neisseriaceae bacterium]
MERNENFKLISALMDGALTSAEEMQRAVDLLLNDIECQKKWEEYHAIGLSLKNLNQKVAFKDQQPLKTVSVKHSQKASTRVFKIGLSLAATITALGVGMGFLLNQNYSFKPEYNMMMTGLSNANSKVAMSTFMSDNNRYDVVDDPEYVKQQRSLDNGFLRAHEISSNTGGIIRVSFPSKNKESVQ